MAHADDALHFLTVSLLDELQTLRGSPQLQVFHLRALANLWQNSICRRFWQSFLSEDIVVETWHSVPMASLIPCRLLLDPVALRWERTFSNCYTGGGHQGRVRDWCKFPETKRICKLSRWMLWIALVSTHNACNCVTIDCKAATIDYLNVHGINLQKAKMSLVKRARQLHKILASTAYYNIMQSKLRGASIGSSIGTSSGIPWEDVQQGWLANLSIKLIKPMGKFNGKTLMHSTLLQVKELKQNTTMIMIMMMLCSYSRFLCRITSQLYS